MPALTDRQLARRPHWRLADDCTGCPHARGFFEPLGSDQVRKRCRRCGTHLWDAPRCPGVTRTRRQCLLPVREDLGYSTCAAHGEVEL